MQANPGREFPPVPASTSSNLTSQEPRSARHPTFGGFGHASGRQFGLSRFEVALEAGPDRLLLAAIDAVTIGVMSLKMPAERATLAGALTRKGVIHERYRIRRQPRGSAPSLRLSGP